MKRLAFLLVFLLARTGIAAAGPRPELPEHIPELPITEMAFLSQESLTYSELAAPLPLKVGETLTREKLERSIDALLERDIFAHIDVVLEQSETGIKVEFLLVPALFVFDLQFSGASAFEDKQLRRLAGLPLGDRLSFDQLLEAERRLLAGYRREGYFAAQIHASISERVISPQVIVRFDIDEGYHSRFGRVRLEGELPADLKDVRSRFIEQASGTIASDDNLKKVRQDLLLKVRNEGYLQASAEVLSADLNPLSGDVDLVLGLDPHQPLSLNFEGNTLFTPAELLEPLRLESRSVPFTPSAIHTLCKEIRRQYQAEGYFFAQCEYRELPAEGTRRNYEVLIVEGRKFILRSLRFEGNTAFSDSQLRHLMETESSSGFFSRQLRPQYLKSDALSADLAAIELFYHEGGYLKARVNFELQIVKDSDALDLIIRVEEGEQATIDKIRVRWKGTTERQFAPDAAIALLELPLNVHEGDPLQAPRLKEEQVRLTNEIVSRGYPNARVDLDIDEDAKTVAFAVTPGVQVRIDRIWLAGNSTISDRLIQRELKLKPGDLLVPNNLRDSEQALFRSGFFKNVEIHPSDGALDEASEDLTVHVSERDTGRLELGTAINSEDGLHLFGEIGQRNLNGTGRSLVMALDGFFKTGGSRLFDAGNARIVYTEPHLFGSDTEWLNEAFAQYSIDEIDPFSYDRLGGSTSLRHQFSEKLYGSLGVTAYYEHLYDVEPDVIIGPDDEGNAVFSFIHGQLELDHRDNAYNPRDGYRSVLQARIHSQAFGSESEFGALYAQHSIFTPLGKRVVWANNFRANYLEPFGSTGVIPLSQRIFLGGRNSLRGFSLYSIGPRGDLGDIVGGDSSVNLNTELRYDFSDSVQGLIFLDFGQAFLQHSGTFAGDTLNFGDLRYSPGVGMRYITPIGPISGEIGFNPEREHGERWGRFHFSVGGAF